MLPFANIGPASCIPHPATRIHRLFINHLITIPDDLPRGGQLTVFLPAYSGNYNYQLPSYLCQNSSYRWSSFLHFRPT